MEERFCERVKKMGCTCVTISHRPALVAFHDIVLALDGEGGWSLHHGAGGEPAEGDPWGLSRQKVLAWNLAQQSAISRHMVCLFPEHAALLTSNISLPCIGLDGLRACVRMRVHG